MATLVPDADAIQQSLATVKTQVGGLANAAQAIASADLTSLAWAIVQGEFPVIYTAMQAQQTNASAFLALNIVADVIAGVEAFAATFQTESGTMLTVLTAVGDGTPAAAQQAELISAWPA